MKMVRFHNNWFRRDGILRVAYEDMPNPYDSDDAGLKQWDKEVAHMVQSGLQSVSVWTSLGKFGPEWIDREELAVLVGELD